MDEQLVEDVVPEETEAETTPAKQPRRSSHSLWLMLALLVIVALPGFLILRHREKTATAMAKPVPTQPGVAISTAVADQRSIGVYINALGSVAPLSTVTVKSRVDGQLMSVNYREGQMVRQGEVLAEIDSRPFQAQLAQAEGQYERDKALLENAMRKSESQKQRFFPLLPSAQRQDSKVLL